MLKKLPAKLYVAIKEQGTADEFLHAGSKESDVADDNAITKVGVYVLHEELEVSTEARIVGRTGALN